MEIQQHFDNLVQATAEDFAAVTNVATANLTLSEQVDLYNNHLSTKEVENAGLYTSIKNLQEEVKISRRKLPPSRGQVTPVAPASPKTRGQGHKKMEKRGTGQPPHLVEH